MIAWSNMITGLIASLNPVAQPKVKKPKRIMSTSVTMASYAKNAHKPCTAGKGCTKPRHVGKDGECSSTMCKAHNNAQQLKNKARREARGNG